MISKPLPESMQQDTQKNLDFFKKSFSPYSAQNEANDIIPIISSRTIILNELELNYSIFISLAWVSAWNSISEYVTW